MSLVEMRKGDNFLINNVRLNNFCGRFPILKKKNYKTGMSEIFVLIF